MYDTRTRYELILHGHVKNISGKVKERGGRENRE